MPRKLLTKSSHDLSFYASQMSSTVAAIKICDSDAMPKINEIDTGTVLKGWTLKSKIDDGGNGDVWSASDSSGEVIAIKILRRANESEPYQRFTSEVQALKKYSGIDGVMPIIDWELPAYKSKDVPWYAMPLATPCLKFLEGFSPEEIVENFIILSKTLVLLHAEGVSHRDIKTANILALNGRLYLSDFGLVRHLNSNNKTPDKRDVGPKFTMAPEMRRSANKAEGVKADVFSFSKALWVCLTRNEFAFDGQYSATSENGLHKVHPKLYTTTLDKLFQDCTAHNPGNRPTIDEVLIRLIEWTEIVSDFRRRNAKQWEEFTYKFFPRGSPRTVIWDDLESIVSVLDEVGRVTSLNHMFLPSGGGNTIKGASKAGEAGFMEIDEGVGTIILKPKQLTFESFSGAAEWNYLRLEADTIDPTGYYEIKNSDLYEYLTELTPGEYDHPDVAEGRFDRDDSSNLPSSIRTVARFLNGSFVIFSTSSPYNQESSTYDARHNKMDEVSFRSYISKSAKVS